MASHLLSRQYNTEATRRRNLVRKVLLESLERRDLMAADVLDLDQSYSSSLTQSVLSQAALSFSSVNPNLTGYDVTSLLDSALGGGSGDLTQRPWFGLVERSYSSWSQANDLAFSFTSELQAEGESRLVGEGEVGGPRLLSVAPNATSIFTFNSVNTLTEAPSELTLRFDDFINTTNLNGITLRAAGKDGVFGNSNDSLVTPGWIGAGDNSRIIVMRFATTLVDDLYRVELAGTGTNAVRSQSGLTLATRQFDSTPSDTALDSVDFRLELGAKVLGVVPQPIDRLPDGTLSPQLNKIRVYFNDDKLDPTSATTPAFYQLVFTNDTVGPQDDRLFTPTSAVYTQAQNMVELTFSHEIQSLPTAGPGTYRLRIGGSDVVDSASNLPAITTTAEVADISGNIQFATDLGSFAGSTSVARTGSIITTSSTVLPLDFPGSNFEPGHRDIQDESHQHAGADSSPQIATIPYNFALNRSYGVNAVGQPVFTSITPEQQQRVREIFELYSRQLGVDFEETEGSGLTIVVGDMYPNGVQSGPGGVAGVAGGGLAIMDGAETWDNTFGGGFAYVATHEIGHLLGLGHTYDLPGGTVMGDRGFIGSVSNSEWSFPGDHDVTHGLHLFRPDNKDVDTYRFLVPAGQAGTLNVESIAQRLSSSSHLDSHVTIFQMTADGPKVLATNDNSFGNDSAISIELDAQATDTTYYVSITAKGNEDFNPLVPNTGSGAVSEGQYELRINFESSTIQSLADVSGTPIDGDGDGDAGGNFNFWFRALPVSTGVPTTTPKVIFVDKSYLGAVANGSPTQPMKDLNFASWPVGLRPTAGDIVRVLGANTSVLTNVPAYEFGRGGVGNSILPDGLTLQVPKGVTLMVDAGAIFKLQGSQISTGSATSAVDNSTSHLQVLGIPGKPVYFTSYKDESLGVDNDSISTVPTAGDWGGINFRSGIDHTQGRQDFESKGIFLNYVAGADIQYGGGIVSVLSPSPLVNPITMFESRPTILNNKITRSADAAISADPNSFEETHFQTPLYQFAGIFSPDYVRVGPDIRGNTLLNNSTNGLFVRTATNPGSAPSTMVVSGKFDDTEVVHVMAENLTIDNQPGGPVVDPSGPDLSLLQLNQLNSPSSTLVSGQNIVYRLTAVDRFGNSSPSSVASATVLLAPGNNAVQLTGLPVATGDFLGRKLWRSINGGAFQLVAELDKSNGTYLDIGASLVGTLTNLATTNRRARGNARLEVAPGIVIKSIGTRIETAIGAQLIAEGTSDDRVVFTSRSDDRYGAGGTFDTGGDGAITNPTAGNWGGLVARHLSSLSIDNALIAYGGGLTSLPGGFAGFSAVEIHQSDARIANTRFESNASGTGGNLAGNRVGRGPNDASVIYVVGSQPTLIDNSFVNNSIANTAVISINANAMTSNSLVDQGRQTGENNRITGSAANVGPLIRGNSMSNNGLNGMRIRGQELTTESIWDDADIVHVLSSEIVVPDFHTYGGLTLRSRGDEGLVVKLGAGAGFTANGVPLDITDRIGGSLRIVGTPGFPVVLTSIADDSVGSGYDITGRPQLDTNNDNNIPNTPPRVPQAGDWRSIRFAAYANDRNVAMNQELESDQIQDEGTNDTVDDAQSLGGLAASLSGGDENLRLGFNIDGAIAAPQDLDVYSFTATAGSTVWLDIDRTSGSLDSIIELVDLAGNVLALSNNSLSESRSTLQPGVPVPPPFTIPSSQYVSSDASKILPTQVRGLDSSVFAPKNSWSPQVATDLYSTNPLDAGLQLTLPGEAGNTDTYYIRVRSSNLLPGDGTDLNAKDINGLPTNKLLNPTELRSGVTTGNYRLQVRLQQSDEVAGSVVQYADIRFATNGIEALGMPGSSPLLGQIREGAGTTPLGRIANSDRGSVTVAGNLGAANEIDSYSFTIFRDEIQRITDPTVGSVAVTFDVDYADGFGRPDTTLWVFDAAGNLVFTGTNSNIADDQSAPTKGSNVDDLTRGSAGTRDAYIGPVELSPGDYTVRVTNNSQVYRAITADPAVRREPLDSVQRISIDRFNGIGTETTSGPLQVSFSSDAADNRVEWNLSDITTYVISNVGNGSQLSFANAMTGAKVADISQFPRVNDAAMSPDGRLVGYQVQVGTLTSDANGGNLLLINSTGTLNSAVIPTGAATAVGASGIQTFTAQQTGATAFAIQQRDYGNGPAGEAIVFNAIGFHTSGGALAMFGVGSRGNGQTTFNTGAFDANGNLVGTGPTSSFTTNIVYRLDPTTGAAINPAGVLDRTGNGRVNGPGAGAGTNKVEFGRFITTGIVQGLAEIDGTLYAVSNQGQLFRAVVGANPTAAFGSTVAPFTTIIDPETGAAVQFNGLTRGPRNMDNPLGGTFNDVLFGTTSNGTIYAFDTNGVLQPVFPGFSYKTQVPGALGTVTGIDFSVLDVNLWHVTNFQNGVAGHGRPATPTNSQLTATTPQNSLYFGFRPTDPQLKGNWNNNVYRVAATNETYDLAGGAHGAIVSNPINLTDYSPDDQPMMYFNYLLGTEGQDEDFQQTERMRDAFRVYGAGEDGNWILLATNNTPSDGDVDRGDPVGGAARNGRFDELDNVVTGNYDVYGAPIQSQQLLDNTAEWRQARVPLAALAGLSNVRLRFEFSTAATLAAGDPLQGGVEIIAVDGNKIVDGTGLTLTPNQINGFGTTRFEFDHGLVLAMPGGAGLTSGVSTVTVNGTTFTFSTVSNAGLNIQYSAGNSPQTIAQLLRTALITRLGIPAADISFDPLRQNVIAVANLPAAGANGVGGGLSAADIVLGTPGVTAGAVPILVNLAMTADQVRDAIRLSFAQALSQPDMLANFGINQAMQTWPISFNTVMVYKFDVSNNTSAVGVTTQRVGDFFGVDKGATPAHNDERAINNNARGVLIDDVVIGFAERGEMVLNDLSPPNLSQPWLPNPEYHATLYGIPQVETGNYQLTVRTAADYGVNAAGSTLLDLSQGRDFDTNDRLSQSVAINVSALAAGRILDGQTFSLSDSTNLLTFEFEVNAGADASVGFVSGRIPVRITNQSTPTEIAAAIRDAINSPTVQSKLAVTAAIKGQAAGSALGTVVELHGAAATNTKGNFGFVITSSLSSTVSGTETAFGEDLGDVERIRQQGQLLLTANRITNSSINGILASAAAQNQGNAGPRPYPGAPINFPTTNPLGLAPGVVVMNNVLANNGVAGLSVQDDASVLAPSPIARVINNTFVGGQFGVQVVNAATPTVLNNIFSATGTAISGTTAVIGYNIYQGNGNPSGSTTEPFGVVLPPGAPLFANSSFYLAAGSQAIDASIDVLVERDPLKQVKEPLGLPPSPMLAPDRDVAGQVRRDDPNVNDPFGTGNNVFKDRGAVERSDSNAPTAFILRPQDNDSQNSDQDRNVTFIRSLEANLNFFSILLQDGTGTGPDPATVVAAAVVLTENGRVLRDGFDYVLGYNANSRTMRLTPLAGIWRNDSVYEITLNNLGGHRVTVPSGSQLRDGDKIAVTIGSTTTTVEFDNNGAATGIAIPFTAGSSAYELAAAISYQLSLAGITSRLEGDGNLFVTGATSVVATTVVAPAIVVTAVKAIQDLAGNPLAPNRPTSLTQFTIVMPEAIIDYGDSPGVRIPTIEAAAPAAPNGNGARHVILPVDYPLLALGTWVDGNADGLPSAAADGDDFDVVVDFGTLAGVTQGTAGPARLQMPAAAVLQGQSMSITDKVTPLVFQFDTTNTLVGGPNLIIVQLNPLDDATQVAQKFAAAVRQALIDARLAGVVPIASGDVVSLGGNANHQFDLGTSPIVRLKQGNVDMVFPSIAGLADGQSMNITDSRGRVVTFELNDTSVPSAVTAGFIGVNVNLLTATPTIVAQAFIAAINSQVTSGNLSLGGAIPFGASAVRILGDDEDGGVFDGLFNAGSPAVATFLTATDFGMLDVWIDWTGDGDFSDSGEKIFNTSIPVRPGINRVEIATPTTAVTGFTTARFRLSTLGGLLSGGVAVGGEVEDYMIEIAPGRPPVANTDSYSLAEDGSLTTSIATGVLANDTDTDVPLVVPGTNVFVYDENPTTLGIEPLVNVTKGTLILEADGRFTYTPTADFNGIDTFVYRATDGRLLSNPPATVTITVTPVNDLPDANNDSMSILEDAVVSSPGVTFTANDFAHFLLETSNTGFHTNEAGQTLTLVRARILAEATTSFGVPNTSVRFTAVTGQGLYGTRVAFGSADLGLNTAPQVSVAGDQILVTLNNNATTPSTINHVLTAIAGNAQANSRITATLVLGSGATVIGNLPTAYSPVILPPSGGVVSVTNNVLSYIPPANYNDAIGGPAKLLLTIADDNTAGPVFDIEVTSTLTINIAPVNDAPIFTLPQTTLTVGEDAGVVNTPNFATNIATGPNTAFDEAGQTLQFVMFSNSAPGLFATQPTISPTGTLNFETAPNANGQAVIIVRLRDSGPSFGNGNVNLSGDQTFTININPINDAPEFVISNTTVTSREDQGLVQVADFLTGILPGPVTAVDEAGQAVTVTVVAVDPTKFTVQPSIGADGRLIFQTATDVNFQNANLEVRVTLTDDGPSTPPNVNFVETTFTIQATEVNDAPVFSITNRNIAVNEDAGQYQEIMVGGIAAGPVTASDEVNQTLQFVVVSVSAPELFSQQPIIDRIGNTTNGRLTFTPAQHKNGSAIIVVRLEDNGLAIAPNVNASGLQTFTITINPINDAPEFTIPGSITVDEDQGLRSANTFATNVRRGPVGADDENGQLLQFIVTAVDPSAFAVQPRIAVDGTLVFQVAENVNSSNAAIDGLSLEVIVQLQDDGLAAPAPNQNLSVTKTFTVIVNPINDSPLSPDFLSSTEEDTELVLDSTSVLVNAVGGPTSDELDQLVFMEQVERVSLRGGSIEPTFDSSDRITSLSYTPPANASGFDSFVYVIRDNGNPSRSGTATISININPTNDPPQFTIGANQSSVEDAGGVTITDWVTDILAGPSDAFDEHGTQMVSFEVLVDDPSLFIIQPTVADDGSLFYQSAPDANGSTTIHIVAVDDGDGTFPNINRSASQSATITIVPLNDAPVFTAGANLTLEEDTGFVPAIWATNIRPAAGLLALPQRALDEQNQIVDFNVVVDRPELFSVQPTVSATGLLSFTTAQNAFGNAVLTIRAVDRGPSGGLHENTSAPATLTIAITGVNDNPVAGNDNYTTDENSILTIAAPGLLSNDFDVDGNSDTIAAIPVTLKSSKGADVTLNADGSFTYDPAAVGEIQRMSNNQFIDDTFTYTVRDGSLAPSNLAVVTIRVNGVNDRPIAVDDQYSIGVGQTRLLDVLTNDTDVDSPIDGRTIQITQVPIFGTVTVDQTGGVRYAAEAGFRGTDTFAYVVRDALGAISNEAFVSVVVNNAPVANPDVSFTYKNEAIVIPVLANDTDQDGSLDIDSIQIVVLPSPNGSAIALPDGTISFTPAANFAGEVTFSYVVSDNVGTTSNVARVTVRVLNSKWQNPAVNLDVNNDGQITPVDALLIVNYLNDPNKDRFLPTSGVVPPPFLDVDGNERVSPNDALLVINYLNERSAGGGGGEGESAGGSVYAMMVTPQQMVDTVGAAVVREVERLLEHLREEAVRDATNSMSLQSDDQSSSNSWDDDDLLAVFSTTEDEERKNKNRKDADEFFAEFGPQLI